MREHWQIWSGLLSDQICDDLLTLAGDFQDAKVIARNGGQMVDEETRRTDIYPMPYGGADAKKAHSILGDYVALANRACFGFDLAEFYEFQLFRYKAENQGYYQEHQDVLWVGRPFHRKLSLTVQLSGPDDYDGGEFVFAEYIPQPPAEKVRERGTVIIFPSMLSHRVDPVTKGCRYSMVGWYEGPQLR